MWMRGIASLAFLAWQPLQPPRRVAAQLCTRGPGVKLRLGLQGATREHAFRRGEGEACAPPSPSRILLALPDRGDEIARLAQLAERRGWALSQRHLPDGLCQTDALAHRVILVECTPPPPPAPPA